MQALDDPYMATPILRLARKRVTWLAILFVGIVFVTMLGQNTALAIGQTDRGGDYIVVTGQFTQNSELVYVTDAAAKRLNSYAYDATQRQVILWDTQDLGKVFASAKN